MPHIGQARAIEVLGHGKDEVQPRHIRLLYAKDAYAQGFERILHLGHKRAEVR